MLSQPRIAVTEALEQLNADGYAVIENLLPTATVTDLRDRVERILEYEREHPFDPGDAVVGVDQVADIDFEYWRSGSDEIDRLKRRIRHRQAAEFDTPWPVDARDVCISFIHIPSLFDDGRSQRIFNLINKDVAFAPLVEHPLLLAMIEHELGRDAIVLDMSVNHVGPHTNSAGWHVDSPLTQVGEPLPNFTLSIQSAWMLDEFTVENGATHVVRGSHLTLRKPPSGRDVLDNEVVLEGPAGSVAVWLSQTWHRHGANVTDGVRNGVIIQYGRSWVKPFVDLRTPMDDEQAAAFSPRLRYMLGCNANAPVRG
ncbi:MAG TPA: phytanoyl-CoA dioxygenase family protein [Ilumatobacteraceae bacterium]|jgi:ectoine hydroxylase-related dioxygenase (phytanoyl-CoA dioxygenase family)